MWILSSIGLILRWRSILIASLFTYYPLLIPIFIIVPIIDLENLIQFSFAVLNKTHLFWLIHHLLTFSIPVFNGLFRILIICFHFGEDFVCAHKGRSLDIMHLVCISSALVILLGVDHTMVVHGNNERSNHLTLRYY